VDELFEKILERSSLPLPGLEDDFKEKARRRAVKINLYLEDRADRLEEECIMCGRTARSSQTRYAYDTPWDDEPRVKHFCSDDCGDTFMYEEPWAYFWCDGCDREICEQNPMNGWHIQYREYDGNTVCLRCYKDLILENGVEREKLEAGKIQGMFFDWGNGQALEKGYQEVPGFTNYHVHTPETAEEFRDKALDFIDHGYRVVIGYERMAIGGSEGYVTLMVRR
jgi:hypothetical protein